MPPTIAAAVGAALAPASIPSPSQSVWHLGPLPIRAYAFCILAGVALAVWWTDRRYRARGGQAEFALDTAMLTVPIGIICARLYHVITSPDAYFGPNGDLARIPRIWEGGIGIWGGVAGGLISGALFLHHRGVRLAPFADAVAPAILAAQAIGRLGNWFNQELFGGPTTLPWGLEIDRAHLPAGYAPGTLFHPTFLYEALWSAAGVCALLWLERRLRRGGASGGRLLWAYLMVYTLGRAWIEHLRIDDAQRILGLRLNEWTSLVVFAVGLIGFIIVTRRGPSDAIRADGGQAGGEAGGAEKPAGGPDAPSREKADDPRDPHRGGN
ncbi:prolipoprotein diacylglyceryl transferase [Actinomyces timonensis]|uniref:prolipoprotein diacylglyceryl transferase n=1 Tax=Actinomyces timonensis TaxID=1288391 RepID=UPI0003158022|nr:prolipoprotein diacylglyceryl transferase [Actinomyces timonensis]